MKKPIENEYVQFVFLGQIATGKVLEVNGKTVKVEIELAGRVMRVKVHLESLIKIKS